MELVQKIGSRLKRDRGDGRRIICQDLRQIQVLMYVHTGPLCRVDNAHDSYVRASEYGFAEFEVALPGLDHFNHLLENSPEPTGNSPRITVSGIHAEDPERLRGVAAQTFASGASSLLIGRSVVGYVRPDEMVEAVLSAHRSVSKSND